MTAILRRLFGAPTGARPADVRRQDRSQALLAAGQLPLSAQERLTHAEDNTFTSDLSPGDLAAVRATGYEPVGQAFGTSTVAVNRTQAMLQSPRPFGLGSAGAWPIRGYFQGELQSRERALRRMQEECRALGGSGVIGIRAARSALSAGVYEFTVVGTAVRPVGTRIDGGMPFLTALTGADFAALARNGWLPVTVVLSMVRWAAPIGGLPGTLLGPSSWAYPTAELTGLTRLQNQARAQAREQLERQTRTASADGLLLHALDVAWERDEATYLIDVEAMGTAIRRGPSPAGTPSRLTLMPVVSLAADRVRTDGPGP